MSTIDFSRYNAPGVSTQAIPGPQVGVTSNAPTSIGLIGYSGATRNDVESILIPADVESVPTASVSLRNLGVIQDTIRVSNPLTGFIYEKSTGEGLGDYEIVVAPGSLAEDTRDDSITIKRISGGEISENTEVQVTYSYLNASFFQTTSFYDYNDVVTAYGSPFDAQGNLVSELTLAAQFAFTNGANRIVCVAVDPGDKEAPNLQDYQDALDKLREVEGISVVVSASGDPLFFPFIKAHVEQMSNQKFERRAILGLDGTAGEYESAERIAEARALASKRIILISPDRFTYYNPITSVDQVIGGQFVAAALAGLAVSMGSQIPLTRKSIVGVRRITKSETATVRDQEAIAGLCVIEERSETGVIRVRHGVTTDTGSILTREWTITGQEDTLAYRLRNFLDSDELIGSVITDLTLTNVKASVDSALQSAVLDGTIRGYNSLQARQLMESPDVIEVRFNWQPSMPLNYIVARFSIDLTTGIATLTEEV